MKIAIGCDDAAYNLKVELIKFLTSLGIECDDFGAGAGDTTLYPNVAEKVAIAVAKGEYDRGILTCGTGIGMCITANKIPGVRAAVCHDVFLQSEQERVMMRRLFVLVKGLSVSNWPKHY